MKPFFAAVIVAAGRSSRMGTSKALMHLGGRRVIDGLVDSYLAAQLSPMVVVASRETADALRDRTDLTLIEGDPDQPMVDSLARGLQACGDQPAAAVVQPVDAPFTSTAMLAALIAGSPHTARILCHAGRPGHPVLVPRTLFEAIDERPDGGLRAVLAAHEVELVEWADDRVLADLDTPEDVARWRTIADSKLH